MANLTDNPSINSGPRVITWTANDTYKLDGNDAVEGAAAGASFGGLGNDNQPHQKLANRTSALYNAIQAFAGEHDFLFNSVSLPAHADGLLIFPMAFAGSNTPVWVQFGFITIGPTTGSANGVLQRPWFQEFPNQVLSVQCTPAILTDVSTPLSMQVTPILVACSKTTFSFRWQIEFVLTGAGAVNPGTVPWGFNYLALGF